MTDLIGKTLGPYRILEQIGVGGMATVYKAYQPGMDRYVAIKILPHYLMQDEQFSKRFQREARAIAKLEHAHILPVHDYGEAGDTTYIAMRYVEAGTLKQRIARGPLPLDEIARLISQIGSALDYAHRMGVIHRDVKPGNVLIDDQGNTYLTDFGLARMMEASDQLTASGVGVGTPTYMSPEQGQGNKVDHRSDIYSLGVVLFEMVTGHVPYEAETPMAVMLKHITDPLPLPRLVNPNVPEPVELVILKALAKDPTHRYQTAGEMAQALNVAVRKASTKEVAAEPRTVEAVPPGKDVSLVTRLERAWAQPRGKVELIGSAVLFLALLALLLSQLPGQVQIVGPGVTATSAIAQAATPAGEATQATIAAPTSTPQTIATPTSDAPPPSAESQVTSLWTTNGPYGGPVNSLAINPNTPTTLYATVFNIGVFRTRNAGESWELVFASEYNNPVAMDPLSPDRIYMGRSGEGLYRSDDGGDTWAAIPIPGRSAETYLAAAHPTLAGTVYAGLDGPCPAGCGLFKSEDYGQTWIDWTNGLTDTLVTALAFDPADSQTMYVGTGKGNVFRSTNGGEAWEFVGQPDQYISLLAVNPFGAHEPWASGADGRGHWGFVSKYASGAWLPVSRGVEPKVWAAAIVFDQNVAGTVWLGPYKSTDGGLTWTDLNAVPRQLIALAVDPTDPRVVYQGYNGAGVYKTTDGGATWQEVNQGLTGLIPNGLVIAPDNPDSVYATVHGTGIFKTTDGGKTWRRIPTENEWPRFPIVDPVKPGRLYVRGTNGVDITENDGATWHRTFPQPPPEYAACCGFELLSMITTGQPGHMVIGGGFMRKDAVAYEVMAGSLYTSDDFGETWSYVDVGREISPVMALAYDPGHPNTIYAAASGSYVLKSTDGGNTWQSSKTGLDSNPGIPGIESIAVEPAPPYRVFAGYGGGFFVSTDEGASWTAVNAPPYGEYGVHWLGFVPGDPPALYASSAQGLFYSIDGAKTWQEVAGALGRQIQSMAASVTEAGVTLYVGATGGVYRLESAPKEAATPLTPQAEQARVFAEPILQAIADRKPDFQDDFSDAPDSVLSLKGGPDDVTYGRPEFQAADFVMQYEFIPKTTDNSNVVFQMRWSPTDMTFLDFSFWPQSGEWRVSSHVDFVVSPIVSGRTRSVGRDLRTQVTVIARGEQFAIYLNEAPLTYFRDSSSKGTGNAIKSQGGLSTTEVDFDNIKFWNLDNVPGLAAAKPEAALHGCGFDDELLFAEDFEDADTTNQIGPWQVTDAPGGGKALHALGVANYTLIDTPIRETHIRFRIQWINDAWVVAFRNNARESYSLGIMTNSPVLNLSLLSDPAWYILRNGSRFPAKQWVTMDILWEDDKTIVIRQNETEVIRYTAPGPVVEQGRVVLWIAPGGANQETWFDDIVICGQGSELPTSTLTPQAEQARAFAEPILQAIANRPPDFEDDFSTADKGWIENWKDGIAIEGGVLRMSGTRSMPDLWANHELFTAPDFALQLEFVPKTAGLESLVSFGFRDADPEPATCALSFAPRSGDWYVFCGTAGANVFYDDGTTEEVEIGARTRLLLIGKGSEFAIYLNDKPFTYFRDDLRPHGRIKIGLNLRGSNTEVEFDNVKFWNLENVPGLP